MSKASSIIRQNEYQIKRYKTYQAMALSEGDTEYAKHCQEQIDRYQGGIKRWSK